MAYTKRYTKKGRRNSKKTNRKKYKMVIVKL